MPAHIRRRYNSVREAYEQWRATRADDDTFAYVDDVSDARGNVLGAMGALVHSCAKQPDSFRRAVAAKCRDGLADLAGDPDFERLVGELEARA